MSETDGQAAASSFSLHQRILSEIEGQVLSGEWPPGFRIPGEVELAALFGCSRMTVNKALSRLVQAGLIERRRKAGSFVRRPVSQSAVLDIKDIRAEVAEQNLPYRYEIVARHRRRSTSGDRAALKSDKPGPVLDILGRHDAGGQPFCLEERLIDLGTVPEAGDERFEAEAPGPWLLTRVPWTAAEHRIRAVGADAAMAKHLDLLPGTACLVVERRTVWSERPVTFVRLTYPGEAHELVARFAPSSG